MRTKTLLCAAALAAGVASSMAQSNVYSLNIVGYANVKIVGGNGLYANPFNVVKNGKTNSADDVLSSRAALDPFGNNAGLDGFTLSLWNGGGFNTVNYSQSFAPGGFYTSTNGWASDGSGNVQVSAPTLTPGTGFFINNGSPEITNVFAGDVTPNPGTTNSVLIGGGNVLLGSACAFLATNGSPVAFQVYQMPLAPLDPFGNNTGLDGFTFSSWNGGGYDTVNYSQSFAPGGFYTSTNGWATDGSGSVQVNPPIIKIGQGFFLNNGSPPIAWKQTITNSP